MAFDTTIDIELSDHGSLGCQFGGYLSELGRNAVAEHLPDLHQFFPFGAGFAIDIAVEENGIIALVINFSSRNPAIVLGVVKTENLSKLRYVYENRIAGSDDPFSPEFERSLCTLDTFTYIGPVKYRKFSKSNLDKHFLDWLQEVVIPVVVEQNRSRVLRAVPQPPSYDCLKISQALWVLECENNLIQGTAFALRGVGLVTCDHVLGRATYAFRYDQPANRYPIKVIKRHPVIDLATLSIQAKPLFELDRGDPRKLQQMDHVLVAEHPNYRLGDSPIFNPGLVVGFRMVSGIRRFLTNAAIIQGGSGGPVFDSEGTVVGVAVTGAERFDAVSNTEDMGVIPIDALDILTA